MLKKCDFEQSGRKDTEVKNEFLDTSLFDKQITYR